MAEMVKLTPQQWCDMCERLSYTAQVIDKMMSALMLREQVPEEDLAACSEEYRSDIYCATQAMAYVAEFAADKVWLAVEE